MESGRSPGGSTYSTESPTGSSQSSESLNTLERTIALFREAMDTPYGKRTVALFVLIGVGFGFAGSLTLSLLLSGEGILDVTFRFVLGIIVLLLVLYFGTALAAVIATQARTTLDRSLIQMSLIDGASCYGGVFAITVLSLRVIRGAFSPIGAVKFGFGRGFVLSAATSILAGIIAPGVAWIDRRFMGVHGRPSEVGR
ncbi:hypothetical protein [Saliphagus infecundisoli]|uniref:Uncharacterized protein n=1 Tax=Saliphagus infecundisoli TaxID=1849069 RepID=A0ABD5QHP5_9EURY|nr:hypothetical protein [Saliphagus infecundisoli]